MNPRPSPQAPLSDLLAEVEILATEGDLSARVRGMTHDSRAVSPGALFVAYQGVNLDVHRFLPDAFARGAAAAIVERPPERLRAELDLPAEATLIQVPEARLARARIACALYDHPSRDLIVIGVTGTDGKTTTSSLIHAMLTAAGRRVGLISTVAALVGAEELDTGLHVTTPEAEDVQAYLAMMRDAGAEIAVLETTSHGLHQHRVTGVAFDLGVLTNITAEALEYHGSFEAYRAAKAQLFWMLSRAQTKPGVVPTAILNADDPSFAHLAAIPVARHLAYALESPADYRAEQLQSGAAGLSFTARTPEGSIEVRSKLPGRYNAANILAAMAAAQALGAPLEALAGGASGLAHIPGRMEQIDAGQAFTAIVDFAHTPNALDQALAAARGLCGPGGRVIAVFGCAGLRDPSKREPMGRIAAKRAELTLATAEDPRTEALDEILAAIATGLREAGAQEGLDGPGHRYLLEPDRGRAIRSACQSAAPEDVVIVCGKGHEQSMCFGTTEHPWDDRAALRAALQGDDLPALPTSGGPRTPGD